MHVLIKSNSSNKDQACEGADEDMTVGNDKATPVEAQSTVDQSCEKKLVVDKANSAFTSVSLSTGQLAAE